MTSGHSLPGNLTPGVYIHEVSGGSRPIIEVGTRTAGFVGKSPKTVAENGRKWQEAVVSQHTTDPANPAEPPAIPAMPLQVEVIDSWTQFQRHFFFENTPDQAWTNLAHAVYGFFLNGGSRCWVADLGTEDTITLDQGLAELAKLDEIAMVAAPGYTSDDDYSQLAAHVKTARDRVAILDIPQDVNTATPLSQYDPPDVARTERGFTTMYAPWLVVADPNLGRTSEGLINRGQTVEVPPSGHVAGIWARTDAAHGVHKAPANQIVQGALGLTANISNDTQTQLSNRGINPIRFFHDTGYLVWGARTLATNSEWRYVNVRRLYNMIEESIAESTRWVVFEPNDELLWASIRRDVNAFLTNLWRQGTLMGSTPEQAFFVKCDAQNNPFDSIGRGCVIIDIGIAPILPAEFVIFRISQCEAGSEVEVG